MKKFLKKKKVEVPSSFSKILDEESPEEKKYKQIFDLFYQKVKPYADWIIQTYPELKKDFEGLLVAFKGKNGHSTFAKQFSC